MTGGTVSFIYGGSGASGSVTGDTEVIINGGEVYASVYGGGNESDVGGKASVTMNGGTVGFGYTGHAVYGGGYGGSVNGSAKVTMTGGTVTDIYGGGYGGSVGSTEVLIGADATVGEESYGTIYGGGYYGGSVTGTAKVTIKGTVGFSVYGGSGGGSVGSTEVLIDTGGKVGSGGYDGISGNVYGGSSTSSYVSGTVTGNTNVTIRGTVTGEVYGGGSYNDVGGSANVLIDTGGTVAGDVYGGGYQSSVTGTASVTIKGTVTQRYGMMGSSSGGNVYGGGYNGSTVGSAHVKCENGSAVKITFDDGISRTASDGDFQSVTAGETAPQGYFEYLSAGHYKLSGTADSEGHAIICTDENCGLRLTDAAVSHTLNADGSCNVCGCMVYDIWVGGVQVGGVPDESGNITVTGGTITGTVTYAPSTGTLTLSDASITAAATPVDVEYNYNPPCGIYSRPALNLVLTGENTITAGTTDYSNGVKADAMDLAISGGGSLTINNCGYGIQANDLVTNDVTLEIIDSVYAISLNEGGTIEDSTVSAIGSNKGISTINGTIGIDNSSVYVKGGSYSFYGSSEVVSVRLSSGAHVKAEGAIRENVGVNSDGSGYLRGASDGTFTLQSSGSLEYSGDYFEYLGAGHCTFSPVAGSEVHAIDCTDENCILKLTNASAPHRWNANANGAVCADCPATAVASVTADTTTAYYYGIGNAVSAADGNSNAVLKLFADVETVTVSTGGFTLDPNGKSITKLSLGDDSQPIGTASKPGNTPAVSAVDYGVFATPSGVTLEAEWFKSDMTGYVVVKDGDNLKLVPGITEDLVEVAESATYNGSAQTPAVTVKWTDGSGAYLTLTKDTNYTVSYTDSNGNSVTAPTYADTYTVTITGVDYASKVEKTYTINKATAPNITYPTADGLTYGHTLADSALSGGSTEYGSFAWKDTSTVPTVGNATGYPVTFTVNANTAKNYETIATTEQNVQVNVTQAAPVISLSASVSGASGNRTVELTATMSAAGSGALPTGTVQFVNITDGGSTEIGTANVSDGTATCTWTATEDKVYTIQAVYNGDTNYTTKTVEKTVDTNKQPQAVLTITGDTTIAYGQTLTLTTIGGSTNGTVTYTVTPSDVASVSGNVLTPTKVGSVTVTATMAGNDTYLDVTSDPVTITITQGTGIGSVTIAGWTYGETAKTPTVTSETNGTDHVTYLYESTDGKGYTGSVAPENAGSYKLTVTFAETDLYEACTDDATFTVKKADPAIGAVTAGVVNDTLDISAIALNRADTTVDGSFTVDAGQELKLGDTEIAYTFTPADTDNYERVTGKVTVTVKDTIAPTGKVTLGTNSWNEFLNNITFGLFFKETQTVSVEATDSFSGVEKIEYYAASDVLDLDGVKALADDKWTVMDGSVNVTAEDAKQFIYYIRITDKSGNIGYLATNGAEFDTTAPVIDGVHNGVTYYTTQKITVTDKNLDTVTLNGEAVTGTITLDGNKEATYIIVATDKAGNATTVTVTMKLTESLGAPLDGITEDNVTSEDKDTIQDVIDQVEDLLDDAVKAAEDVNKPADTNSPQTGDNTSLWLWIALLLVSGGAVITLTVYDRKRRTVNSK